MSYQSTRILLPVVCDILMVSYLKCCKDGVETDCHKCWNEHKWLWTACEPCSELHSV